MSRELIFVTGFFGSPIMERARQLAEEKGYGLLSLDEEIEKADGRTIQRLCMTMGEHAYRNREYEALLRIVGENAGSGESGGQASAGRRDRTQNPQDLPKSLFSSICANGLVVACGDGALLDDMSRTLMTGHTLCIVGGDMSCESLWQNARKIKNSYHAFMHFGSEEERRRAFEALHQRQRAFYASCVI